jgi:hypothetical protein
MWVSPDFASCGLECTCRYGSKTVDKKEILRTVSNTGIYCSSDKVDTVYLV